ncbi:alpha/beta fold hydrolase [Streptococcus ovuberis]|uniref:Acetylxylan esterase n=1 Tax=Streptococcus ovuberis TaxID=1936207 RepID=A0A7X6N373_9STRE|nr:alpha/beta fold hydrolase [Streptococcus ovuberis]NKZ21307.1 acetylxylan esterase [Streptococcus ovuberis]
MQDSMTLEEMQTYKGRQEVPEDFDAFWDGLLESHTALPPFRLKEKQTGLSGADFYELTFEADNGSEVFAKCVFPKSENPSPVLFYFHGYQGQSPDWTENLKFVAAGFGVVCMDVRGQAGRSTDKGQFEGMTVKGQVIRGAVQGRDHLFYKDVYLDVYQLIEIVASLDFVDAEKLYSYGASQGGALALVAGGLSPRIKKVVSIYPFLSDFKRIWELGDTNEPYNELFRYFRFSDPFHETEDAFFEALSYIDIKNLAHRITCPVHMVTGLEDIICPPSTQFAIYNRLTCPKTLQLLPEYGHDVLNVKVNDYVFDRLFGTSILD